MTKDLHDVCFESDSLQAIILVNNTGSCLASDEVVVEELCRPRTGYSFQYRTREGNCAAHFVAKYVNLYEVVWTSFFLFSCWML